jgi:hypothetical protein
MKALPPEMPNFSNMLYLQPIRFGDPFCIFRDYLSPGLSKGRTIEDSDLVGIQERRHTLSIVPSGEAPPKAKPIITGDATTNLVLIAFGNQHYPSFHFQAFSSEPLAKSP